MSHTNATCPTTSSKKRFCGNPLKNPNSKGVKNDEYIAYNTINFSQTRYHLHIEDRTLNDPGAKIQIKKACKKKKL